MYPVSPLNPPIYPEDRDYMCGHWLVEYEKIHRGMKKGELDKVVVQLFLFFKCNVTM